MAVKSENKRATVTLNPLQQEELTKLAKKYAVSESKFLAHGLDLLIMQEKAHFKTGLEKCLHFLMRGENEDDEKTKIFN